MVTDLLGREVAVLADGVLEAGRHVRAFQAGSLATGVYHYTLTTGTLRLQEHDAGPLRP